MNYVQRKFYLPKDLYFELMFQAQRSNKTTSDVVREILAEGMVHKKKKEAGQGARILLKLAKLAEKEQWGKGAPRDLSVNHNKYFVEAYDGNS